MDPGSSNAAKLPRTCGVGLLVFGIALLLYGQVVQADYQCDDPLPDFDIIAPGSEVPEAHSKFSGVWHGKWGNSLCSRLVIERVNKDGEVQGIYSWGKGRNFDPGYMAFESEVDDDEIEFGDRARFKVWPGKQDGTINISRRYRDQYNRLTMKLISME